jgi:DNA repair exonuclease SbcCD nuclease subunit
MPRTTSVIIITDLHFRSDNVTGFLNAQVDTLLRLVNKKKYDWLVINGDVFEKRNPRGEEMLAFKSFLEQCTARNIVINRGNHDTVRKDGTSDTTLDLYQDLATVVKDTQTIRIGNVDFDFIPHYEDEQKIIDDLAATDNPVFGHFGFHGCVSNGAYKYEAKVKRKHFRNKLSFLGHIHKPRQYGNVYVLGTQYSNTFGEANARKYIHELYIRDGEIEVVKKPIEFGIRHIIGSLDEIESLNKKYKFGSFFTLLRVQLDKLDSYAETRIKEDLIGKYGVSHLELSFDNILPKHTSTYRANQKVFTIDDDIIMKYLENKDSVFTKEELLSGLEQIKDETK